MRNSLLTALFAVLLTASLARADLEYQFYFRDTHGLGIHDQGCSFRSPDFITTGYFSIDPCVLTDDDFLHGVHSWTLTQGAAWITDTLAGHNYACFGFGNSDFPVEITPAFCSGLLAMEFTEVGFPNNVTASLGLHEPYLSFGIPVPYGWHLVVTEVPEPSSVLLLITVLILMGIVFSLPPPRHAYPANIKIRSASSTVTVLPAFKADKQCVKRQLVQWNEVVRASLGGQH